MNAETASPFSILQSVCPSLSHSSCAVRWRRWGAQLYLTGDDVYRIEASGRIYAHESAWHAPAGFPSTSGKALGPSSSS